MAKKTFAGECIENKIIKFKDERLFFTQIIISKDEIDIIEKRRTKKREKL